MTQITNDISRVFDLVTYVKKQYSQPVFFDKIKNDWQGVFADTYSSMVDEVSFALIQHGIKKRDNIVTITNNRSEFNILEMGILQIGGVHVALSPATNDAKLKAIIDETRSRIVFVSNTQWLSKIKRLQAECEFIEQVVTFDDIDNAYCFKDFLHHGNIHANPALLNEIKQSITPQDTACLIYISGSSTDVNGVELTHYNLTHTFLSYAQIWDNNPESRCLCILPLAHSYERVNNYSFQYLGVPIYYNDGLKSLFSDFQTVKPTIIFVVPILLQNIAKTLFQKSLPNNRITSWLYRKIANITMLGKKPTWKITQYFHGKMIAIPWRKLLGNTIETIACGGAALPKEYINVFESIGIHVAEGFGITEAGPIVCVNTSPSKKYTLGRPIPGVEIKLNSDGEILVKSPGVMKGYYLKPEATKQVIDSGGWLYTGDEGVIDTDGYLTITGIKKTIFKMSNGLYINPLKIEKMFENNFNNYSIWIFGHNKPYLIAIISIFVNQRSNVPNMNNNVQQEIANWINTYNINAVKNEKIVGFHIVNDEWSDTTGLRDMHNQLMRSSLQTKYHDILNKLYQVRHSK